MPIQNKTLLMVAQYAAPYEGNFMKSLYAFEERLKEKGSQVMYVLPQAAKDCDWFEEASRKHKFFLTDNKPSKAMNDLGRIFLETHPDIVHTHFDGYDIAVVKTLRKLGMNQTEVVWHLHDHIGFMPDLFRTVYQVYSYIRHYGWHGRNVSVIAANYEVGFSANIWNLLWNKQPYKNFAIIPNALDESRISLRKQLKGRIHSFLAFGGRNKDKRIDLLADAGTILGGGNFEIYITNGSDTKQVLYDKFNGSLPEWLHIIEQRENVNEVYDMADCFVSSSDAETFSYAILEATIAGLPVIQSDIQATMWNADNPSTFLFRQGSAEALANAMLKVMHSETNVLQSACEETRKRNLANYSMLRWCEKIEDFYAKL